MILKHEELTSCVSSNGGIFILFNKSTQKNRLWNLKGIEKEMIREYCFSIIPHYIDFKDQVNYKQGWVVLKGEKRGK